MPRKTLKERAEELRKTNTSMRPRPDAAENPRSGKPRYPFSTDFNEAAARCRGKPRTEQTASGTGQILQ